MTEDETVGWHYQCKEHELGQTPGDGEGQGSLACCSPWGREESDMTWQLNNHNNNKELAVFFKAITHVLSVLKLYLTSFFEFALISSNNAASS